MSVRQMMLGREPAAGGGGGGLSIVDTATTASPSGVTSHTLNIPAGSSGDLIVVVFVLSGNNTITLPSGWTLLYETNTNGEDCVFYRVADGSEGSTITVGTSSNAFASSIAYRISGQAASGFIEGGYVYGSTNPPSLTPSWGSAENLWIITASTRGTDDRFTAPSGYGDQLDAYGGSDEFQTNTAYNRVATAHRILTASTEDPDAWSVTGSTNNPRAGTIAVRPA